MLLVEISNIPAARLRARHIRWDRISHPLAVDIRNIPVSNMNEQRRLVAVLFLTRRRRHMNEKKVMRTEQKAYVVRCCFVCFGVA